jgi:hypothetical protein
METRRQTQPKIELCAARERDVDLLILEELVSCLGFRDHFLSLLKGQVPKSAVMVRAARSVWDASGQSDIELEFHSPGTRMVLLVENKIDAAFQPKQADRYQLRGEEYVRRGDCDAFATVLIAPSRYLNGQLQGFDTAIAYEDVANWFRDNRRQSARAYWKLTLLDLAIKQKQQTSPVGDPDVTAFWQGYWLLANEMAPELHMAEPGPRSGGFVFFRSPTLPSHIYLVHKLHHGRVDLQLSGMAPHLDALRDVVEPLLGDGIQFGHAGKSAVVRADVPLLDARGKFFEQTDAAKQGLLAAKSLLSWFNTHRNVLSKATAKATSAGAR